MKLICTILLLALLAPFAAHTDVPQLISFQGRLTSSTGNAVADSTYNLTFQMYEHDPPLLGEPVLWQSGPLPVTVTDGMFVHYLGSVTPLPVSVFGDDNLDSYFVRVLVEGTLLASDGIQIVSAPFAYRAATADITEHAVQSDTADYAHAGPGSGATGWVDDGSVVRLQSSSDKVGIGTSSPTDRLVIGGNLGTSIDDNYVVVRNNHLTYSGYRLGFNSDNFGWMRWSGLGEELRFGTRTLGVNYLNTMVMRRGNVGIGTPSPSEPLVVGKDLGTFGGTRVVVGSDAPDTYTGLVVGEEPDERGWFVWDVNENALAIGVEDSPSLWSDMIKLKNGEVHVGVGSGNSSVRLPSDAISASEILDEPGIRSASRFNNFTIQEDWSEFLSTSAAIPTSGYAVVFGTFTVHFWKSVGGHDILEFAIADSNGVAPHTYRYSLGSGDWASGPIQCPVTIHEIYAVSEGTAEFSFLVKGGFGYDEFMVENARMTVMFFPTVYGTKDGGVVADEWIDVVQPVHGTSPRGAIADTDRQSVRPEKDVMQSRIDRLEQVNADLRRRLEAIEAKLDR